MLGNMGQCEKHGHMAGAVRARAGRPPNRPPIVGAMPLRLAAKVRNGRLGEVCRAGPNLPHVLLNLLPKTWAQKVPFQHKMEWGSQQAGASPRRGPAQHQVSACLTRTPKAESVGECKEQGARGPDSSNPDAGLSSTAHWRQPLSEPRWQALSWRVQRLAKGHRDSLRGTTLFMHAGTSVFIIKLFVAKSTVKDKNLVTMHRFWKIPFCTLTSSEEVWLERSP